MLAIWTNDAGHAVSPGCSRTRTPYGELGLSTPRRTAGDSSSDDWWHPRRPGREADPSLDDGESHRGPPGIAQKSSQDPSWLSGLSLTLGRSFGPIATGPSGRASPPVRVGVGGRTSTGSPGHGILVPLFGDRRPRGQVGPDRLLMIGVDPSPDLCQNSRAPMADLMRRCRRDASASPEGIATVPDRGPDPRLGGRARRARACRAQSEALAG